MSIRKQAMNERNIANKKRHKKCINHINEKEKLITNKPESNMDYNDFGRFIDIVKNSPKEKKIPHMIDFIKHEALEINKTIN